MKKLDRQVVSSLIVCLSLLSIYLSTNPPTIYASHPVDTEGWYCDGNDVWHDVPDGTHEFWKSCEEGTECQSIEPQDDFTQDADCLPTEEPSESPSSSAAPRISPLPSGVSSEERAIYNLNSLRLPQGAIPESPPKGSELLNALKTALTNLVSKLFFFALPQNPPNVFVKSGALEETKLPADLKPDSDQDEKDILNENVTQFYGISLPDQTCDKDSIRESEKCYQKANFPSGISPITGSIKP